MSTPEEKAQQMLRTGLKVGVKVGVKHYHPKTGILLTTVKEIIETLRTEGNIHIDFGEENNKIYKSL
jgi:hypothetical protein